MKNKRILLVGGGGHCRSVLDSLLSMNTYDNIGIIEKGSSDGTTLLNVPIVGSDSDLPQLFATGWTYAAVTLGSVGNPMRRRALYHTLKEIGFTLPVIADPSAIIGRETEIGEGTFIGKRAIVNSGSKIGCCAIINTGAILEHGCTVGSFAHIGPGGVLCGDAAIEDDVHIGANAVLRQGIRIGTGSLIGAGSVVVKDVAKYTEAFGNPCQTVRSLTDRIAITTNIAPTLEK